MNRRGVIALAIVAAAMAAYIVLSGRGRDGGGRGTARARLMPAFDRATVRRIEIRRSTGENVLLLHMPSPRVPAPAPAWCLQMEGLPAADDAVVEDLLAAIDLAESDRTADLTPAAAGLERPLAEIDVATPAGTHELDLGNADATGRNVYARVGPDGPIRVIGSRVRELADRDPAAFRDRRLFPVEAAAVTAMTWRDPAGEGELRAVEGRWKNGRGEWVASERVAESLRRFHLLRIDRFERAGAAKVDGGRTFTMTAGAARIALEVRKDGDLVRGDERVHVPADAFEAAWRSLAPAAARDERLLALAPDTVSSVDLADDHARLSLRRVGGAWTFSTPKVAYAADTKVVDDWLARLGTVRTTTRSGGPSTRHLIAVGRFRQQVDVSAPPDVYALLAPDPLRFRERAVLSFARFDVRRLQRTAGKATQQVTTTDGGGSWQAPAGEAADAANVSQVVGALSDLRADEFVASPPPGEPAVRLQIDVQPPGERQLVPHVLKILDAKEGCAAVLDTDAIFTLERAACDALRLPLLKKPD